MGARYKQATDLAGTVTAVKAASGRLLSIDIINASGATAYVQLFDVAAASVTLGTTEPIIQKGVANGADLHVDWPVGIACSTAISVASTTAATGSSGSAAGVDVLVGYE